MLATPWPRPFDDDRWWFEVKWDGYRCLAAGEGRLARLRSRRGLDLADRFPEVAARPVPEGWILDGEIVVFADDGRPDFSLLQRGGRAATYVVFDVLATPAGAVWDRPLDERRALLGDVALDDRIVVSDVVEGAGTALYDAVVERGMEGIVGKRVDSVYTPGRRSPDWRKIAHRRSLRAVVGGWLPGEGGRSSSFGSLLVGLWDADRLRWIGAVGSGFGDAELAAVAGALGELERPTSPFAPDDALPAGARWVEPGIVAVVEFKEWTADGRLRAPVFKGVAPIPPRDVTWEAEGPVSPPSSPPS